MKCKGEYPTVVQWLHKTYDRGAKLTKQAMQAVEDRLERMPGLDKWFVQINPATE